MVITETIKSNGRELKPGSYNLLSIDTIAEFNRIPRAELKLSDGSIANQNFETLDGKDFLPGSLIEVFLKKEGDISTEEKVFGGVVINHELERSMQSSVLTIELSDVSVKMTTLRNNRLFNEKTDDKIIKELIGQHVGLKIGEIEKTKLAHPQMVQYYASDWDFMLSRAEANGLLVTAEAGELSVVQPQLQAPALRCTFGINLDDFNLKLNSRLQYKDITSFGLDTKNELLALTKAKKGKDHTLGTVDYDAKELSSVRGATEAQQIHAVPTDPLEMQSWSDAQVLKSRLSLVLGTVQIPGNGKIKVGQTLKLENVSRFNGAHIISGVRHSYTLKSGWSTHLQIGMDADWCSAKSDVIDTKAAGLLPGVNGLQIGMVQGHEEDSDHGFRVLVNIPAFKQGDKPAEVLAMYTSLDAGADHGIFFPPLKGDRVVVGFLNDDPRQAIILGSMHSNKVPHKDKKKNKYKGIFTQSNYQLLFDEETELITLSATDENNANENKISIDQKKMEINLEDANGNKILLNKEGITISSTGDCQIKADGDFGIDAKGKVKIKGKKVDLI
ncbi:MAG: type VI secretion system tip protein VgrG [Crocinitomicaceae bacterium]